MFAALFMKKKRFAWPNIDLITTTLRPISACAKPRRHPFLYCI